VTNSDDSFFNKSGAPGRSFVTRVNPADPGQTEGATETASTAPASATSDAAMAAEHFVQQVKQEEAAPSAASSVAGNKRAHASLTTAPVKKQPQQQQLSNDDYDLDEESMPFLPSPDEQGGDTPAAKKAKKDTA